jgi:hypothetical protein
MSDSNKNLVMGPRWWCDTKMNWPTDRRSRNNFNFQRICDHTARWCTFPFTGTWSSGWNWPLTSVKYNIKNVCNYSIPPVSGLGEFELSVYGSCFLSPTLVHSLPESPSHFSRDLHKIWCCYFAGSIAKSHQARCTTPNKRAYKICTSSQLRETLYKDIQHTPVLSSTVASHYYNCCIDGSSPGNDGYPLVLSPIKRSFIYRCPSSYDNALWLFLSRNFQIFRVDV